MPQVRESGGARVIVDDRHIPVVIYLWSGATTVELASWHMAENERICAELVARKQKFVLVSDASASDRPSPAVRKVFAEAVERTPDSHGEFTLGNIVVISSPLMRGAMTALSWVTTKMAKMDTVATMQEGLERALGELDAAGVPRPEGLDPANYCPHTL